MINYKGVSMSELVEVNVNELLDSLQEMSVEELVTLVNMCTQVIEDKSSKF